MKWNWQLKNWPRFSYEKSIIEPSEKELLLQAGYFSGVLEHLSQSEQDTVKVQILRDETLSSSKIEGELLDRNSLQSSILKAFGMNTTSKRIPSKEAANGELAVLLYKTYEKKLTTKMLCSFHELLFQDEKELIVGAFRSNSDPMQIVSGRLDASREVHFEAVPGKLVNQEMSGFVNWYNNQSIHLSPLIRAGLTHVYFEAIHPFEDGNGRVGRLLAEKALSSSLGAPTLLLLSSMMEEKRKDYYQALASTNRTLEVTEWLCWFSKIVLLAQKRSKNKISFLIEKSNFFKHFENQLSPRQEKVLLRMFKEGSDGFKGGLSAENYIKVSKTSPSTATRDLQDLVKKKALVRKGERKHARYYLALS